MLRLSTLCKPTACAAIVALGVVTAWALPVASAATFRTANFEATAESPRLAQEFAQTAEQHRRALAEEWLGKPLERWKSRCRIEVKANPNASGSGWTSYVVNRGVVHDIEISLDGPPERLLEYVLPHEITHTIVVTFLGKLIPRWADEGVAMMSESQSQRLRQQRVMEQLVRSRQALPLRQVLDLVEYPQDKREVHAFYAASLSLTEFLVTQGERAQLFRFLIDRERIGWDQALERHYGYRNVESMEAAWSAWVVQDAAAGVDIAGVEAVPTTSETTGVE